MSSLTSVARSVLECLMVHNSSSEEDAGEVYMNKCIGRGLCSPGGPHVRSAAVREGHPLTHPLSSFTHRDSFLSLEISLTHSQAQTLSVSETDAS